MPKARRESPTLTRKDKSRAGNCVSGVVRPYNDTLLQPGVITSMEPSLYIPGVGILMINDMVLVTETDAEVLTHYPRELKSAW